MKFNKIILLVFYLPSLLMAKDLTNEYSNPTGAEGSWNGNVDISIDAFSKKAAECGANPENLKYLLEGMRDNLLNALSRSGATQKGEKAIIQFAIVLNNNAKLESLKGITLNEESQKFFDLLPTFGQFPRFPKNGKCLAGNPYKFTLVVNPRYFLLAEQLSVLNIQLRVHPTLAHFIIPPPTI